MIRKEGFYFVLPKDTKRWEVAEFINKRITFWVLIGSVNCFHDSDFEEIDERIIERQP